MTIILPSLVTPPTTTAFSTMVDDISAFLPGCPSPVIERTVRKTAIDLCQRAKVWEVDLTPVTLVSGEYQYTLESPYSYADVTDITAASISPDGVSRTTVRWVPLQTLRMTRPSWPDDAGQPMYVSVSEPADLLVAPVPEATMPLYLRANLRPTATATEWPTYLHDEFRRVVFHGTLHELLMMPGRSWSQADKTSAATAAYHGKQWVFLLNAARHRANTGYNARSLSVQMTPFA